MQTSATSVETTLGAQPTGAVWPADAILDHKRRVEISETGQPSGLVWDILGGIPVHDDIKLGRTSRQVYVDAFKQNVRRLARHGVRRILFTVMPLLDWVRTDLSYRLPNGVETLRFDMVDFAVFDLFLLKRTGAEQNYSTAILEQAKARFHDMSPARREALLGMLTKGLPGGPRYYERDEFAELVAQYAALDIETYRQNLIDFLGEVAAVCVEEGAVLGLHPDDPPFTICGFPRIASTLDDFRKIFNGVSSPAVGFIFCAGSLGSRADNDLTAIIRELGDRIVYAHPRTIRRVGNDGSFVEAEHLDTGADIDLCEVLRLLLLEERRREPAHPVWSEIPYRADHAARILYDQEREDFVPGYTPIGLIKATAELRGMVHALARSL